MFGVSMFAFGEERKRVKVFTDDESLRITFLRSYDSLILCCFSLLCQSFRYHHHHHSSCRVKYFNGIDI